MMTRRDPEAGSDFKVRTYRPQDQADVLDLLRMAFREWPSDIESVDRADFFSWKHTASPFGPSRMLVAEIDEAIVGFWALMPWRLAARGVTYQTTRSGDLAVHPLHRSRGVSMALRAAATFDGGEALQWSESNASGRPGALKAGAHRLGKIPRYILPRPNLRRAISRADNENVVTSATSLVEADSAGDLLNGAVDLPGNGRQATDARGCLETVKDLAFLRWRYGRLNEYRAVRSVQPEGGVAIFRPRMWGRLLVLDVCELLPGPNELPVTRDLIRRVSKAAPADFVMCNFSSHRNAARCGFVRYGGAVLNVWPRDASVAPDPTVRRSWCLSRGDLELL